MVAGWACMTTCSDVGRRTSSIYEYLFRCRTKIISNIRGFAPTLDEDHIQYTSTCIFNIRVLVLRESLHAGPGVHSQQPSMSCLGTSTHPKNAFRVESENHHVHPFCSDAVPFFDQPCLRIFSVGVGSSRLDEEAP